MFKVGFVQFCPVRYDVDRNVQTIRGLLAGVRADLLVLPELANSGYAFAAPAELSPYAEDGRGSGPFLSALRELSAQTGALMISGFAEQGSSGLYNSAAAVDEHGVVHVYRKTHLFSNEKKLFRPGDSGFHVFDWHGLRAGMMICFDWTMPEAARTLALAGAHIIAHPSNLVLPYCQQAMVTRCLENGVFSITANRYGSETLGDVTLRFTGRSQVLDTKGRTLVDAAAEGDCVAICEIDPALAENKENGLGNDLFADRRPEMYRLG